MIHDPVDIRQLRYFLAIAEAGSFSRAADHLGISQPSISQQMRDVEARLRVTLFQRRGKRILLTVAGRVFQEHARSLLRQYEIFLQEVSSGPEQLHGTLCLGVVPILDTALVPTLLGEFAVRNPSISVSVDEVSSTEIETALEEGRMDLGLGFITRHSPNLRYERLCSDEFALIVPKGHPWWNRQVIDLSEIHQQRLVQLPDSFVTRRMTDELCRNHQVRPKTIAEVSAIGTLLRSLAPLKAAALMPKIALLGTHGLRLKAIRLRGKNLKLQIGLLRLKGSTGNSTVQAFDRLARAVVPKLIKPNSTTKP
jgi:LysR family cyn operon transcriptional activator